MEFFQGEFHALALKANPDFRVLRKIERRATYPRAIPEHARIGVLVHVEMTGPNPDADEIISMAMIRFAYTDTGTILGQTNVFAGLRQPKKPITKHVARVTGITRDDVKGKKISTDEIGEFIQGADLIISHDAARSRRFCERFHPDFQHCRWACSRTQIPWTYEGVVCNELPFIAFRQGFFIEGDATDKLYGLLQVLEMPLPSSGRIAQAVLSEAAGRESRVIWALGAPFEVRDQLRNRGYHWHGGHDGRYRAWYREVDPVQVDIELQFLDRLDFPDICPLVTVVDATLRFSDRLF